MNILQKTIAAILILTLFSLVVFIFIIQPTIADIKTFNDLVQIERVSLENKYDNRRNIKNIMADLKYVADNIDAVSKKITVPQGREVEFISELELIAQKNNIIQKIKISPAPIPEGGIKIAAKENMTIALSGGYIDILRYLSDLEKSDLYIIINSINIFSGGATADSVKTAGFVKANLEGYVYFSL